MFNFSYLGNPVKTSTFEMVAPDGWESQLDEFFRFSWGYFSASAVDTIPECALKHMDDVKVDGVDMSDYPDFCDGYVSYAKYKGRVLEDEEIDYINDNYPDWVYEQVTNSLI